MYHYVESLRRKPDHHKQRVAIIGSGIVTAMIFIGWVSVIFPSNTSQIVSDTPANQSSFVDAEGNTPMEGLRRSTAQVYDSIKALFTNTSKQINLQEGYSKMKSQVENGDIKITPDNPSASQ